MYTCLEPISLNRQAALPGVYRAPLITSSPLQFRFELEPVGQIAPLGEEADRKLHGSYEINNFRVAGDTSGAADKLGCNPLDHEARCSIDCLQSMLYRASLQVPFGGFDTYVGAILPQ